MLIVPEMKDVLEAAKFLEGRIRRTPVEMSLPLSEAARSEVFLKLENLQLCGSFKVRGALNKMYSLSGPEKDRGVITASSGNHAQGVAMAANLLGVRAVICVPGSCPQTKRDAILSRGKGMVELRVIGRFYDEAEEEAKAAAEREKLVYVSAYEDHHIVCGQGTLGLEFLLDVPDLDLLIVPISGGGLIAGVATAARALRPGIEVVGVHASTNPSWKVAWEKGEVVPVEESDTYADALSGAASRLLFPVIRKVVSGVAEVSEREIARAIAFLHSRHHQVVEGAGSVGVAAVLAGKIHLAGKKTGIIISGGNIGDATLLKAVVEAGDMD
ncbi:MAG TPA: threonine/serine dehydratase [Synergistales bacterium]|nr:threonine/serine dehydratase [Synergistales bacterium]HQO83474.1 threonine/serine dehydratase [Synergistales bacterium]HQQ09863.1 threonine/serine dehydratase [Synergistales bacterium]